MSRKKSRKVGLIGVRKDPNRKPDRTNKEERIKKPKGKPAGSRNNVDQTQKSTRPNQGRKDPRLGSKKPVQLVKPTEPVTKTKQRKFATPAQELAFIEADEKLTRLLDLLDEGKSISSEEQAYVAEKMARHKILCDLMGISEDEDEEDIDPLDSLESISWDEFKD